MVCQFDAYQAVVHENRQTDQSTPQVVASLLGQFDQRGGASARRRRVWRCGSTASLLGMAGGSAGLLDRLLAVTDDCAGGLASGGEAAHCERIGTARRG
jgi:hypothetical protein